MNIIKPIVNPSEAQVKSVEKRHELISRMFSGDKDAGKEMDKLVEDITGIHTIDFHHSKKK